MTVDGDRGSDTAKEKFRPTLHGFRGLLALWVMTYHSSPSGMSWFKVSSYGFSAVDVFFMLSGYVLMHNHFGPMFNLRAVTALKFYRSRWWRTYPLYFFCVLLSIVFMICLSAPPSMRHIGVAVFLLEGWALKGLGVNSPVWSLGVEWCGYIAFPFIVYCLHRIQRWLAPLLLLFVLSAELIGLHVLAKDNLDVIAGFPAIARMSGGFLTGCVLWLLHSGKPARTSGGDALFAISLVATVLTFLFLPASFGIVPLLGMLHCIACPGKQTYRVFAAPLAIWLGKISFSLYLSHLLVLKLVKQFWPFEVRHGLDTVVAVFLALGVAALICAVIEEPTRRLSHRIAATKATRAIA